MQRSYKPVLVGIFIDKLPALEFPFEEVAEQFYAFYRDRAARGLPVERYPVTFVVNGTVDRQLCRKVAAQIIQVVFQASHGYAQLRRGQVRLLRPEVWRAFETPEVAAIARRILQMALQRFYERIEAAGEAVYARQEPAELQETDLLVSFLPDTDGRDDLFILWPADEEAD